MKVLIADDDLDCIDITTYVLRREGYFVTAAVDGDQAVKRWQSEKPDLVILDVMLPKLSGFEVCRRIRNESRVPVLMLTQRSESDDVVRGLDLGANDYITKPFTYKELLARMRNAMRTGGIQQPPHPGDQISVGDIVLDIDTHEVVRNGRQVRLTPLEFRLFYHLASNAGRLVSTAKIVEYVWGLKDGGDGNLLKTHISHIRSKLDLQPGRPGYIKNIPGIGYTIL